MTNTTHHLDIRTINAVISLARNLLVGDGQIRLGRFIAALRAGTTKVKYGAYVSEHWAAFRGITDAQLKHFHDFVLFNLDQVDGPLTCRPTGEHSLVWGYADLRCGTCGHDALGAAKSGIDDIGDRRVRALKAGHPDAGHRRVAGVLPDTTWSLPRTRVRT